MTTLRRVEAADVPALEAEYESEDAAGEYGWWGFSDVGRVARPFEAGTIIGDDSGSLVVAGDDGGVVGMVSWHATLNGPPPVGACWNVGIWIVQAHRGMGHGSEAQRLVAAYLFAHTTMHRVEASTEITNLAEQRALEKAGFTREGVLRGACFRAGEWRDVVMFSKLRGES